MPGAAASCASTLTPVRRTNHVKMIVAVPAPISSWGTSANNSPAAEPDQLQGWHMFRTACALLICSAQMAPCWHATAWQGVAEDARKGVAVAVPDVRPGLAS